MSLSSHRKTRESLREREMLWEHKPLSGCFHSIPQLRNFLPYTSACFVRVINEKLLEYDLRATSCTYSRALGSKLGGFLFFLFKIGERNAQASCSLMRTRLWDRGGELRGPHSAPHGISNYDNKTTKNDNKTDKGYEWSKNFLSDPDHGTMKLFDLKNTITRCMGT